MPCNHPESNTIPCMECGKNFCSICDPPKGSGQCCPACYEKLLSGLVQKTTKTSVKERVQRKTDSTRGKVGDTASAIKEKTKAAASAVKGSPGKFVSLLKTKVKAARDYFHGRFPVTLVEKQGLEEVPPLRETWYRFLILTLGGAAVWIVIASLAQQRNPLSSLFIAALVAVGVVWTFGTKNDIRVAVVALLLALAALLIGEVGLLFLIRLSVVKKMDLTPVSLYSLNQTGTVYSSFFFKVLIWRLLPSAVLAFLIGLWPLPKRLSWKGFAKKTDTPGPGKLQTSS